ncbi:MULTISPECIES: glycine cleavage system protein GcvH [Microbacterium]|jgi:glycine cleavage system H protein|uniref:glycine cleavage system protein GcvH n=1 Tax=Microbacterium TaxID=33882 RepID=UPI0009590A39|nr:MULTISPECIES: glycine cleavage system protein GcvH [Microbacterium]OJU39968.1 MAG: glycine cleavage system protein H [Microbacterium sp. 69-10]GLC85009.1 glycine cleavage system H protein [Microbacterium arabinogalactanolyticum]
MTDLTTLKYSEEHEWVALEGSVATVGITDYAADALGDIVFVELPAVGTELSSGDVFGEAESTKSVSELYAPVAGTVVEVNQAIVDDPSLVNSSPFEDAWMIKVEVADGALDGLLDRDGYTAITEG